jgi:hypothetical protein
MSRLLHLRHRGRALDVGTIVVSAVSDGRFVARPGSSGVRMPPPRAAAAVRPPRPGVAPDRLLPGPHRGPVRPGRRGMGPTESSAGDKDGSCRLFGGQLPVGLRALGVERDEVTDVVGPHLHPDHVGWLFDLESRPSFPRASIWFGVGDWRFFVEGRHTPLIQDHVQQGCRAAADRPGQHRRRASWQSRRRGTHLATAGSWSAPTAKAGGDAVPCPCSWTSRAGTPSSRLTRDLPHRTREHLWRELEANGVSGTGAYFPELEVGRVRGSGKRRWT